MKRNEVHIKESKRRQANIELYSANNINNNNNNNNDNTTMISMAP